MNKLLTAIIITSIGLSACVEQKSKAYKKQRTPTAIKIDKLNLANNKLALRFNYRSYVVKTLESIHCDVRFNTDSELMINKTFSLELGAFATEVLNFNNVDLGNIKNTKTIDYTLSCHIYYKQGQELVSDSSILHLIPSEQFIYR